MLYENCQLRPNRLSRVRSPYARILAGVIGLVHGAEMYQMTGCQIVDAMLETVPTQVPSDDLYRPTDALALA